ncbi:PhnD/SsuA/transferrin family substrate-binding protein [Rheinheimera texasensis]|uniref:phosphate/phosphite/phosphonate ABC transporter substrate-binding protein n=1 Tax=Rheinheimera texasensis TaxID=306205 RepID=UPI0032B2D242
MSERKVRHWSLLLHRSFLLLLLCCSLQSAARPLVVATYAYPQINREAAVTPLATWLAATQQREVIVQVARDPAELVLWARQGSVDMVVPNLVAYLQIQQQQPAMLDFVVPAAPMQSDSKPQYTSSLLAKKLPDLTQLPSWLQQGRTLTVFAVWPDSASGGLIGRAELKTRLADQFSQLRFEYVGSHQAVLPALGKASEGLAIVATAALPATLPAGISEIWRSAELPFGPLLCNSQTLPCEALRPRLMAERATATAVLQGLQQGWVEFQHSRTLVTVDTRPYQAIRALLAEQK